MYTYNPNEYIQQAKLRIGDISLQDYINSANAIIQNGNEEQQQTNTSAVATTYAQGQKVVGDTLGMIAKDIFTGLSKAFEGIADFGAGLVGTIAGAAGDKSTEQVLADYVARDTTNEYVWNGMFKGTNQDFEASAINKMSETGQNIVRGVAQGVGGMIPTIAISLISRGAGASAGVASVLSLGQMGVSAAGTATEEALNDVIGYDENGKEIHTTLDRAFLYGLANGAMEIATETLIGGAYEGIFGKGLLDGVVKNLSKNVKFGKLIGWLVNNLGEGVEEIVSAVFDDTLRTIYNSPDGKMHWKAPELQSVIENGIIGSLTAVVMGGASNVLSRVSTKNAIGMSLQSINENNAWATNLQNKGRFDETRASNYQADNEKQLKKIEKRLKMMNEVKRAKIMSQMPQLYTYFNQDGTRIEKQQLNAGATEITNANIARQNGTLDARITDTNKVANQLHLAEQNLAHQEKPVVEHLSVVDDLDSDTQRKSVEKIKKLNELSGRAIKLVVFQSDAGENTQVNAFINDDTMFISKDKLNDTESFTKAWAHEVLGHFTEDTLLHKLLVAELKSINPEVYKQVEDMINKDDRYSQKSKQTEIEAHLIEYIIGTNQDIIDRLYRKNANILVKIHNSLKTIIKALQDVFETKDKDGNIKESTRTERFLSKFPYYHHINAMAKAIEATLTQGGYKLIKGKIKEDEEKVNAKKAAFIKSLGKKAGDVAYNVVENEGLVNQYSYATWTEPVIRTLDKKGKKVVMKSGKEILQEQFDKNLANIENETERNRAKRAYDKIIQDMDNVAEIVLSLSKEFASIKRFLNAKPYYREDGTLMLSALVSNGEYELNIDFTTICKKREQLSLFLQEYVEKGYDFGKQGGLTEQAMEELNNLFKKYDLDTACSLCFVEARRQNINNWINKVLTDWNNALKKAKVENPTPISSLDGLEKIDTLYGINGEITRETLDKISIAFANDTDAIVAAETSKTKDEKDEGKDYYRMLKYIQKAKNEPDKYPIYSFTKDDLLNTKVITAVKSIAPDFYSFLTTSYGVNNPKMLLPATPYVSNLLNDDVIYVAHKDGSVTTKKADYAGSPKVMVTSKTAQDILDIGGVRINSFSDFQISRVLDYLQFIADCSSKGFAVQTYTKELAMCKLFGKCKIKGNLSVIFEVDKQYMEKLKKSNGIKYARDYAGLNENGDYILSSDTDIDYFNEAVKLQEKSGIKGDWGICGVGLSKYHILAMLDDSRIKMIIPYHKSGMPKHMAFYFNHDFYTDFSKEQTTKELNENGEWNKMKKDIFSEVFYKAYHEKNGDYFYATQKYLEYCQENKLMPRFAYEWDANKTLAENLANPANYMVAHPNYYKVLIDFTSDGGTDLNGNPIFVEQKGLEVNLDGVNIEKIISEEATKLEEQYKLYNDATKDDAIFKNFSDSLQGELNEKEAKKIRDERIKKENEKNIVSSKSDNEETIQMSLKIGDETINVEAEKKKNLVAIHNLYQDEMLKALDLGGFAMPSIAVTKAEIPHEHYGDITIVFDKNTIDPKANKKNYVYSHDAWTPTFPKIHVKLNINKARDLVKTLSKKIEMNDWYARSVENFFNQFVDFNGEMFVEEKTYDKEEISSKAKHFAGILASYLAEKGKDVDIKPVYRKREYYSRGMTLTGEKLEEIIDAAGIKNDVDVRNLRYGEGDINKKELRKIIEAYVDATTKSFYEEDDSSNKELYKSFRDTYVNSLATDNVIVYPILDMMRDYFNYTYNKTNLEYVDRGETERKLLVEINKLKNNDFEDWIWDKFSQLYERKGILRDTEPVEKNGNRKSFAQMHTEYNLENVVKRMLQDEQVGAFGWGVSTLLAKISKQFKSIDEIREYKDAIKLEDDVGLKAFKNILKKLENEIVANVDTDGTFDSESLEGILSEIIDTNKPINRENIKKAWNTYVDNTTIWDNLTYIEDTIADKILTFLEFLKTAPTTYFEAKPRRAIGLDEIVVVLVPEGEYSQDLIKKLKEKQVPYATYDENKYGERSKIIDQMDDIKFSLSSSRDSDGKRLTNGQVNYFKDSKVRDANGNLLAVYHGTDQSPFTIFGETRNKAQFGVYKFGDYNVNFFTKNKDIAEGYTELGYDNGNNIYKVYLDIKKPYTIESSKSQEWRNTWKNIQDENLKKLQDEIYKDFRKKWLNKTNIKDKDLDEINKTLVLLGYEMHPSIERPSQYDDRGYDKRINEYDVYYAPNNTLQGGTIAEFSYSLEDLFEKDGILDEILSEEFGDKNERFLTSDDVVRLVLFMNENKKTDYDGIIIKDIRDIGSKGGILDGNTDDYITIKASNQIKSVDNLNPTEHDDIQMSLVGMHWGDLNYGKKADTRDRMGGRGTGHFGTGFYFVSKDNYGDMNYDYDEARPIFEIDLNPYNLFKPRTNDEAYRLHDGLKDVNDAAQFIDDLYFNEDVALRELDDIYDNYNREDLIKELIKFADKNGITRYVDFMYNYAVNGESLNEVLNWVINETTYRDVELYKQVKDAIEWKARKTSYLESSIRSLSGILGVDAEQLKTLIKRADYISQETNNSTSTELMKLLGYEGVGVYDLVDDGEWASPDNFKYGSVIYDLKPNTYKMTRGKIYYEMPYNVEKLYEKEFDGYKVKKVNIKEVIDKNNMLSNDNIFNRRRDVWGNNIDDYHIDTDKLVDDWSIYSPIRLHADYSVQDGNHRLLAMYNDGYQFADVLVENEKGFEARQKVEKQIDEMLSHPVEEEDIAFSLKTYRDSQGNEISTNQRNYFKDTKVVDDKGNLMLVYHGTEGQFFVFNKDYSSNAFFFSNLKNMARSYGDTIMPVYLNIKKPYVVDAKGNFWNDIYDKNQPTNKLLDKLEKIRSEERDLSETDFPKKAIDLMKNYGWRIVEKKDFSYDTKREIEKYDWLREQNPQYQVILSKGAWNYIYANGLTDFLESYYDENPIYVTETTREIVSRIQHPFNKKLGIWEDSNKYDGIIIKNVIDYGKYGAGRFKSADIYIAFEPNQIKDINNMNPTEDDDIRFSLSNDNRPIVKKTKKDVEKAASDVFFYDERNHKDMFGVLSKEETTNIAREIVNIAPTIPANMIDKFCDDIADDIVERMSYDDMRMFDNKMYDIADLKRKKKASNQFIHSIKFSDNNKQEIKFRADKDGYMNILRKYSAKKDGMPLDVAIEYMYDAIEIPMPDMNNENDLFFEWLDKVDNLDRTIALSQEEVKGRYTRAQSNMTEEQKDAVKENIRERLVDALTPIVDNAKLVRDNILAEEKAKLQEQVDKKYNEKVKELKDKAKEAEQKNKERLNELIEQARNKAAKDVERKTKDILENTQKVVDRAHEDVLKVTEETSKMKSRFKALKDITKKAVFFRKESLKNYPDSSMFGDEGVEQAISGLGRLAAYGYAGGKQGRKIVADFIEKFYNPQNERIAEWFDQDLYEDLQAIANNRTKTTKSGKVMNNGSDLSFEEVKVIERMLKAAEHIVQNYNKLLIDGKYQNIDEKAGQAVDIMKNYKGMMHDAKMARMFRYFIANAIEPRVVLRWLFGMQDNVISELYEDIAKGETKAQAIELHFAMMLRDFYKNHKGYNKTLSKKLTFRGHKMTKAQLLTLIKYYEQEHSNEAVERTGWAIKDKKTGKYDISKGLIDMDSLISPEEIADLKNRFDGQQLQEEIDNLKAKHKEEKVKAAVQEMYDLLTEEDKAYLELISDIMEEAAKIQIETDIAFKGFSVINPETARKYLPIRRYGMDFKIDSFKAMLDSMKVDQAGNQSISKNRVKNAKHLELVAIDQLALTYFHQLGVYAGLAVPIKEFQRAYNFNVSHNVNKPLSIRNTLAQEVWAYANDYIQKLLGDIQGFDRGQSIGSKILSKARSGYVVASLGLNIKVMLTQFASYPTAFSILRASSLAKAFTRRVSFKEMDKYSEYAHTRDALGDATKAEGADNNFKSMEKIAKVMMLPIQKVDRFTIGMLWNACQFEIESRHKGDATYKFGTEENKKEAAELLEQVSRRTQPNYTTTERTGIQRSSSELIRWTLGSFTSVPSKMLSRVVECALEVKALWYRIHKLHENVSPEERKAIGQKFVKSVTAVTMSNLMYVLIAQAMKFALDKDRKDKDGNEIEWWQDMLIDFGGVSAGMIPFFKDLYNSFVQGYDFNGATFSTSAISDLISLTSDFIDMVGDVANGKSTSSSKIASSIKQLATAISTLIGIPFRNVYNQLYGIIKRFNPSAAYQMNSVFYSTSNYSKDLKKAVEDGDTDLANTIMGLMLEDKGITKLSDKVTDKIRSLYEKGFNVLPRTIGDSVTIDGETYPLSAAQQKQIKSVYDEANAKVEKLIDGKGFNSLDEKVQAKAIKWIYDYYYEYAVAKTLGLTADSKKLLYGETMSVERFALAISVCSSLTSDIDKKGNKIANSKKNKIIATLRQAGMSRAEREMVLAYLGYSVDETIITRYIRSLGLSKNQQKIFKSYVSFAAAA